VSPSDGSGLLHLVKLLGQGRQVLIAFQDNPAHRRPSHGGLQHLPNLRRCWIGVAIDECAIVPSSTCKVELHHPVPRPSIEQVVEILPLVDGVGVEIGDVAEQAASGSVEDGREELSRCARGFARGERRLLKSGGMPRDPDATSLKRAGIIP